VRFNLISSAKVRICSFLEMELYVCIGYTVCKTITYFILDNTCVRGEITLGEA
jgi:hypothetical protein